VVVAGKATALVLAGLKKSNTALEVKRGLLYIEGKTAYI
jgi:hypothetical protein